MGPVDCAHIAQDPWAEPHALERRVVLADGDFIVCAAGVVGPSLVRKNALRDHFEVVQIEDLFQWWASVHECLAPTVGIGDGLDDLGQGLWVDGANVLLFREVGCDGVGRVDGIVGFGRVGTSILEDDFASAGMF